MFSKIFAIFLGYAFLEVAIRVDPGFPLSRFEFLLIVPAFLLAWASDQYFNLSNPQSWIFGLLLSALFIFAKRRLFTKCKCNRRIL